MRDMEIGQIVDYVEEYNLMHGEKSEKKEKEKIVKRKATQADWDALMG